MPSKLKSPRKAVSSASKPQERKANPFEERSNHRARHPALNRKVKGAKRNVGQARTKAQERRETELTSKVLQRKSATKIVDRRFGETTGENKLSQEEKMLRRFQLVRSKKRSNKFQLGDENNNDEEDEEDAGFTHQGRSISEVLDEEAIVEESDDEDVETLIARLKSGERLNALSDEPKKHLTKREAMLDVVRKSKILKMERQREKGEDEEEADRVDALIRDVVLEGALSFRPTGASKEAEEKPKPDDYERMVRELQMDRGPRAVATERTRTPEEIASLELKELERLETERLKRMEDEDEDEANEDEDEKPSGRSRKRRRTTSGEDEQETLDSVDLPFIIECPGSHAEMLEFLSAHPTADLNVVLTRIRKSTSVHVKAENRSRLAKLGQILVDHLVLVAERLAQLDSDDSYMQSSPETMNIIAAHLVEIAKDAPREIATSFANKIEATRRLLEIQLSRATKMNDLGGDLGINQRESALASEKKMPGGHKEGLADSLNAELSRLSQLKLEKDLSHSPTRCWPSFGDLAMFACIPVLFSASDQRHPIVSSAALLLGRALAECPIRGYRDVCVAVQVAEILHQMIHRTEAGMSRFAPEVFLVLRVITGQASHTVKSEGVAVAHLECLIAADANNSLVCTAFDFVRRAMKKTDHDGSSLRGYVSFNDLSDKRKVKLGVRVLDRVGKLLALCAESVESLPSADVLLEDIADNIKSIPALSVVVPIVDRVIVRCRRERKPLRMQEFAPQDKSLAPRFLSESISAKRPGDETRTLKRQLKRERKNVARDLRLDGQFVAEARSKDKFQQMQESRAARQANFRSLEGQQAQFNKLVKEGVAVKGAGAGGLSYKGRKKGKKLVEGDD